MDDKHSMGSSYDEQNHFEHHSNQDNSIEKSQNEHLGEYKLTTEKSDPSNPNIIQTASKQSEPKNRNHLGWKAFFAGMLGGFIPAIVVIVLLMYNIVPLPVQDQDETTSIPNTQSDDDKIVTTLAPDDAEPSTNIDEVADAVVGVLNLQQRSIWEPSEEVGSGSGIIYKKEDGKAYIVTNEHVVNDAQEVEIVLNNDERINAKVLGADKLSDLAVLVIDGSKIKTTAKLGSSEDLKVGQTVYAIGNPLGIEFANSLTKGIVSGLNRSVSVDTNQDGYPDWLTEVIQTDAAINPGNSGGALVDQNGNVVGINSMKVARQEVEGIGFAIPIDAALPIMEQLQEKGEVARPFIGISSAPLSQVPPQYRDQISVPKGIDGGMVVASIEPGSPADRAGFQQFDIITKINGNKITSILELRKFLYSETLVGDTIEIEYYRNGKKKSAQLKLTERSRD